jgi:hypothetical protein
MITRPARTVRRVWSRAAVCRLSRANTRRPSVWCRHVAASISAFVGNPWARDPPTSEEQLMPADRPDTSDLGQNLTRRGARQRRRPNQGPRMADVPERRLGGCGSSGRAERRSRTVLDGDSVLDPVGAITRITGVGGHPHGPFRRAFCGTVWQANAARRLPTRGRHLIEARSAATSADRLFGANGTTVQPPTRSRAGAGSGRGGTGGEPGRSGDASRDGLVSPRETRSSLRVGSPPLLERCRRQWNEGAGCWWAGLGPRWSPSRSRRGGAVQCRGVAAGWRH